MTSRLKTMLGLAAVAAIASSPAASAMPRQNGEERLAHLLAGRVAGKPIECLSHSDSEDVQVIDRTALVYGSGRTIYVNRTSNPRELDSNDYLVTVLHTPQLCRNEVVRFRDRSSHMFTGFVSLDNFVPYTRLPNPPR